MISDTEGSSIEIIQSEQQREIERKINRASGIYGVIIAKSLTVMSLEFQKGRRKSVMQKKYLKK